MLEISTIKNGIVIDHIEAGYGYQVFKWLNLHEAAYTVALIKNVPSEKTGKKDIIKIENQIDLDLDVLGLFGEGITINIIQDESIVKKLKLTVPDNVDSVLTCKNPRCICNHERHMQTSFHLVDKEKKKYACNYCDHIIEIEEMKRYASR